MSENVSYSTTVMDGGAGSAVKETLEQRGIFFHDIEAWAAAAKREEELGRLLKKELETQINNVLDKNVSGKYTEEMNRMEAMLSAFFQVPEFKLFAEQTRGKELQSLRNEIKNISRAMDKGNNNKELLKSAANVQKRIEGLATDVQKELCRVEKQVMFETVSSSFHDLGYIVEAMGNFLKATLGQTCIWAETNQYGELSMDISGFSGLSCMKEMSRIEDRFKKFGLVLKRTSSKVHGRHEGGKLANKLRPLFPEFKKIEYKNEKIKGQRKIIRQKETFKI